MRVGEVEVDLNRTHSGILKLPDQVLNKGARLKMTALGLNKPPLQSHHVATESVAVGR